MRCVYLHIDLHKFPSTLLLLNTVASLMFHVFIVNCFSWFISKLISRVGMKDLPSKLYHLELNNNFSTEKKSTSFSKNWQRLINFTHHQTEQQLPVFDRFVSFLNGLSISNRSLLKLETGGPPFYT